MEAFLLYCFGEGGGRGGAYIWRGLHMEVSLFSEFYSIIYFFQVPDDAGQDDNNESEDEILNRESLTKRLLENEK